MSPSNVLFIVMAVLALASEVRAQESEILPSSSGTIYVEAEQPKTLTPADQLDQMERELENLRREDEVMKEMLKNTSGPKSGLFQVRVEIQTEMSRLQKEKEAMLKRVYDNAPKDERKVRDKLQKEADRELKDKNRQADAFRRGRVTGCSEEDAEAMVVYPIANAVSLSARVVLNIHSDPNDLPFSVYDQDGRLVIKDFCPGARATVSQARRWNDGGFTTLYWVAKSETGTVTSPQFTVSYWDEQQLFGRRKQNFEWAPRLPQPALEQAPVTTYGLGGVTSTTVTTSRPSGSGGSYQWPHYVLDALKPPSRTR